MPLRRPWVGLLLAGGSSSRFGGNKLEHPLVDGTPMVMQAARRLAAHCDLTLTVVRPGMAHWAPVLEAEGIAVLECAHAALGMGHSLAAGVRASAEAAGWIIALGDMPWIEAASYQIVINAMKNGASAAAPVFGARRGHPAGFARRWHQELANLHGDQGARSVLAHAGNELQLCPVDDPGVLRDVDTRADLADGKQG
jgi:molybdenum cofactor cytidylyltransferase